MENKCSNCIYWESDYTVNERGFADCDNTDGGMRIDYRVDDDQGLVIHLLTHKDFYCKGFTERKGKESAC